jgi:PAP2 superfamily
MKILKLTCFLSLTILAQSCWDKKDPEPEPLLPTEKVISPDIAIKWSKSLQYFVKNQPANTPTYTSRGYGYMTLAMYESVVQGSIKYKSIAPSLDGLGTLPKPTGTIDWETALNESQRTLITKIWQNSFVTFVTHVDSLHASILKERKAAITDTMVIFNSRNYGRAIANTIHEWSKNDGGDLAYFKNFDANYKFPAGNGYWEAPVNGQVSSPFPLQPYWGKNRTFLKANSEIPMPEKLMYSVDKASAYFKDFNEIYDITNNLTTEQKEIAIWWSDDPSATPAPAGHSLNLCTQLLELKKNNLFEATSALAKVGISAADAFVCCWKIKFNYHSERPANYIRRNIKSNFLQFWPEPPFPAFPSGHSTQVNAAAVAMISTFGDNVAFTDNTHKGRPRDEFRNLDFKPRMYTSISQAAEECGISRLYGGIHTRQDNDAGINLGKKVGENVSKLPWKI